MPLSWTPLPQWCWVALPWLADAAVWVEPLLALLPSVFMNDGMVMMGVSSFWQKVIKGAVIVLAVIIDQVQARMQERIALQKQQEMK